MPLYISALGLTLTEGQSYIFKVVDPSMNDYTICTSPFPVLLDQPLPSAPPERSLTWAMMSETRRLVTCCTTFSFFVSPLISST